MPGYCFDDGFHCENCDKTIGGGLYDFEESKQLLRDKNWITRRFQGEWLNFCCEQCLKEYRDKMQN